MLSLWCLRGSLGLRWPGLDEGGRGHSEGPEGPGRHGQSGGSQTWLHIQHAYVWFLSSVGRSQDVTAFEFAAQVEKHWPRAFAGASISPCVPVHSLCVHTWCLLE